MNSIVESLLVTVAGFILGGAILTVIASFSLKFFIKKIVHELTSDETKNRFSKWPESTIRNGITETLKDEQIKKTVLEILDIVKKRIE